MTSLDIILDDVSMVFPNDHIFGLYCLATKPIPSFPSELDLIGCRSSENDLISCRSLEIGIDEYFDSSIEQQVDVPCEFDVPLRCLDSPKEESSPIDSVIDVDFDIPIKYDLPMHGSANFGVNISLLVDATKFMYTYEYLKFEDTRIQVTINRSIPLNLLHTIMVLFFLRYMTLSWIACCLGIGLPPFSI